LTPESDRDLTVVTLKAMQFNALVGILPSEITVPQPIEVDLVLSVERAEKIDAQHILDYRLAYDVVAGVVSAGHVDLLEKLAESIAALVLALPLVSGVRVSIRKMRVSLPGPLAYAEVAIERQRG
jgi:dihydroneopterin aldolase